MALNLVVMGPPGAGKGTQADRVTVNRRLPKVSTGEILRAAIKAGTPLGLAAKAMMDAGSLVDDAIVVGIVRERLAEPDAVRGVLLDGFPRTVAQAQALDAVLAERDNGPLVVINIEVPDDEIVHRLLHRRVCQDCGSNAEPNDEGDVCHKCGGSLVQRADDVEDVVRARLRVYAEQTRPLIDFYRSRPTFRSVNGAQRPDRVLAALEAAITSALEGTS